MEFSDTDLSALVMKEIAQIEVALAGEAADDCRRGLRHLLGDRRLRVSADPDRGFRVEGALRLRLNALCPPDGGHRAGTCQDGSGGGI